MPRHKPTTKIDVIGHLDLSPENAVGDYIESKKQEKFFINPYNWDTAGESIEMLYIQNEYEYQRMLRLQKEMLKNARIQSTKNNERIQEFYKTQEELRERFINVNDFLKDCSDKKKLALEKIEQETAAHLELKANIEKYQNSIKELNEFRLELKMIVEEFEPYERIIEEVVEKSDIFTTVNDCMNRCDALKLAQKQIAKLENEKVHEIDVLRKNMVKITNETSLIALGMKNNLTQIEHAYNAANDDCLKWEKILVNAKNFVAENDLNKARALDGIQNMYRMLCQRRGMEAIFQRHEIEKQLDLIKNEVIILRDIIIECEKEKNKIL